MTLVGFPPVSDADLMRLGDLNPGWHFERDDEGAIVVSPPSWRSGASNVEALQQLAAWVKSEIASPSDNWNDLMAKIAMYIREGSLYAVAIDPARNDIFSLGTAPAGLHLDFEPIIRAAF